MSRESGPFNLGNTYVRLCRDGVAEPLETGDTFWRDLAEGRLGDFRNEYLVTTNAFVSHWPMWEMHPNGDEIVVLLSGSVDLILEKKSGNRILPLRDVGGWVLVPKGIWHTARVFTPSTMLFITAGEGTLHRQVDL